MILGIDPGASGALAWLDDDGHLVDVADMPTMTITVGKAAKREIDCHALADLIVRRKVDHVWIEKVHAMPGNGATSMFAFGRAFGHCEMAVIALGRPLSYVTPQAWAKSTGTGKGKDASRLRACQLWPESSHLFARVKDDGRAEAALIAAHGHSLRPIGRTS